MANQTLPCISELSECPHCGCEEFFIREKAVGHIRSAYRFDGGDADNTGMYDGLSSVPQKFVFCSCCQEKIARNDLDYP